MNVMIGTEMKQYNYIYSLHAAMVDTFLRESNLRAVLLPYPYLSLLLENPNTNWQNNVFWHLKVHVLHLWQNMKNCSSNYFLHEDFFSCSKRFVFLVLDCNSSYLHLFFFVCLWGRLVKSRLISYHPFFREFANFRETEKFIAFFVITISLKKLLESLLRVTSFSEKQLSRMEGLEYASSPKLFLKNVSI